jgi:integrase
MLIHVVLAEIAPGCPSTSASPLMPRASHAHPAPPRAVEKIPEFKRITSHGARHTAGSSYAYLGAGNKGIAILLGHKNMASTERHSHMASDGTAALVASRWERLSSRPDS